MHDTLDVPGERTTKSVRERDLDNFLLEELHASAHFRTWFLSHLTDCLDIPEYSSVKVGKNPKREVAAGQTDLSLVLCDDNGSQVAHILIESKVGSGFEKGQPERYAEEIEAARERIGRRSAAAVVVAPESNKAVLDHCCFDASIRLEGVIDHLRVRFDSCDAGNPLSVELRERLAARIDLLDALARTLTTF